jgi:hypothetical protein
MPPPRGNIVDISERTGKKRIVGGRIERAIANSAQALITEA